MTGPSLAPRRRRDLPVVKATPGIGPLVILAGVIATPIGLAVTIDDTTYDTWGAYIWGPVLLALLLPLCRWVAKRSREPHIAGFLFGAAVLKVIVGSVARYYMVDAVYAGGDAVRYDRAAGELAPELRQGIFDNMGKLSGTRVIEVVTASVQAVIGDTFLGSFMVFSAAGFVGLCLFYLAFREMLPAGDPRLYRRLLFLTPTLWFWPSSVGKEAFLMLCLGAAAYGYARLLHGHGAGLVVGGLGLWGLVGVRPHVALMFVIGAMTALPPGQTLARDADDPAPAPKRVRRFLLPLVVLAAAPLILGSVEGFFDLDRLDPDSAQDLRDEVERRTSQGGSEFTAPDTSNPIGFLSGAATVMARPFPWEASGAQLLSATETVALAAVLGVAIAARRGRLLLALRERWPRLALGYGVAFAWGFSAVANFGILARQRSLMLPFLFVLIAASRRPAHSDRAHPANAASNTSQSLAGLRPHGHPSASTHHRLGS